MAKCKIFIKNNLIINNRMKIQIKISKQHNNKVNKLKILINKMKRPSEIILKI